MILLLDRCFVIHLRCCSLISSSGLHMSPVPVEPEKHTRTHTFTLVILGQSLCSFRQNSGCPSSPITVATELHRDSLQIGYVTPNAGAPALHTHSPTQREHVTHHYKHFFLNTHEKAHTCSVSEGCWCAECRLHTPSCVQRQAICLRCSTLALHTLVTV